MTPFPWAELSTELALCVLGVVLFVTDTFLTDPQRKHWLGYLAFGGLLLCLVPASGVCAGNSTVTSLFGVDAPFARGKRLTKVLAAR